MKTTRLFLVALVCSGLAACAKSEDHSERPDVLKPPASRDSGRNDGAENGTPGSPTPPPADPDQPAPGPGQPPAPLKDVWFCKSPFSNRTAQIMGLASDLVAKVQLRLDGGPVIDLKDGEALFRLPSDKSRGRFCHPTTVNGERALWVLDVRAAHGTSGAVDALLTRYREVGPSVSCAETARLEPYDEKLALRCEFRGGEAPRAGLLPATRGTMDLGFAQDAGAKTIFDVSEWPKSASAWGLRFSRVDSRKRAFLVLQEPPVVTIDEADSGAPRGSMPTPSAATILRLTPAGDRDPSFGQGGRVDLSLPPEILGFNVGFHVVDLLEDGAGGFFVLGHMHNGGELFIAHWNERGERDTHWLDRGFLALPESVSPHGVRVGRLIRHGSRILVAINRRPTGAKSNVCAFFEVDSMGMAQSAFAKKITDRCAAEGLSTWDATRTQQGEVVFLLGGETWTRFRLLRLSATGEWTQSTGEFGRGESANALENGARILPVGNDIVFLHQRRSKDYWGTSTAYEFQRVNSDGKILNLDLSFDDDDLNVPFPLTGGRESLLVFENGSFALQSRWVGTLSSTLQPGTYFVAPKGFLSLDPNDPRSSTSWRSALPNSRASLDHLGLRLPEKNFDVALWADTQGGILQVHRYLDRTGKNPRLVLTRTRSR